ncbi:amino acid/polyamine transporter I [Yarrowia lipolytica]|uniref:YALI0D00495p n=2 Tax=Yarrowia lipolytica TaxID=4952 RepID=Q6CAR8_YARLI|nr:YALI0D00495p [Yarrowia lipolytica CLIB122]AOW03381.1 hypothetical protein YALI1_D00515g [Yarrowia lipolytica]KAB8282585.1 amino acid/polyamine transporter I [Yarrowia lipolytica]KAE8173235.1 amino acid/polyamine transporter I [Yarrowia lipolytica]KAJ8054958.1 amino acid/polyamine transporter I [Yarrowia lipolytica]QNP98673.1 GABA-specific permease [Yarrowia lipolytica]|eukprot:XP_502244.1 YALI0D00495p [Yarrowia lipolytica CLIB122]
MGELELEAQQSVHQHDEAVLADIGYKPELARNFSMLQVFGIAFSIMGLLPSIATTLSYTLPAGPYGMVWGWFVASGCIMTVGLAMAELGSALPTSGGLYWWTYHFAPEGAKRPLSFLVGYSNTLGLTGGIMSIDYGFAQIFVSVIIIATDGKWNPSPYTVYGIFAACVISHALVGSLGTSHMAKAQTVCIYTNIAIIVVMIIALPIGGRHHLNSGEYMFGHIDNLTDGWPSGWVFFLTWLSPIWTIGSFDSCVHMSEEASNASRAVPFGIISSIGMCWVLGFVINIVFVAVLPHDISPLLETVYQQPMAQLVYDVLGKNWAIGIMVVLFVLQWTMGLSIVTAASRQSWAFSRDGALPFSNFFKVINEKFSNPVRCVWGNSILALAIGCLCMIDAAAAAALFSLSAGGNALAWGVPIFLKLVWGRKKFVPGPFYMGDFLSVAVAAFACFYLTFTIALLQFPQTTSHPTKETMNYTCIILAAVWGGCLSYYYLFAHKWYQGPKTTLEPVVVDGQVVGYNEEADHHKKIEADYDHGHQASSQTSSE